MKALDGVRVYADSTKYWYGGGFVILTVENDEGGSSTDLTPKQARKLAAKLIRRADEADSAAPVALTAPVAPSPITWLDPPCSGSANVIRGSN